MTIDELITFYQSELKHAKFSANRQHQAEYHRGRVAVLSSVIKNLQNVQVALDAD